MTNEMFLGAKGNARIELKELEDTQWYVQLITSVSGHCSNLVDVKLYDMPSRNFYDILSISTYEDGTTITTGIELKDINSPSTKYDNLTISNDRKIKNFQRAMKQPDKYGIVLDRAMVVAHYTDDVIRWWEIDDREYETKLYNNLIVHNKPEFGRAYQEMALLHNGESQTISFKYDHNIVQTNYYLYNHNYEDDVYGSELWYHPTVDEIEDKRMSLLNKIY